MSIISLTPAFSQQKGVAKTDSIEVTINLSEIMLQAEQVSKQARALVSQLQDTTRYRSFETAASELTKTVNKAKEESDFFLKSYLRKWLIQNLITRWTRESEKTLKLNNQLSEVIRKAEEDLRKTQELRTAWIKKRTEVLQSEVGESLRKPINDLLADLRDEERTLQAGLKNYLALQEKVSASRLIINTYLDILNPLLNQDFVTFFKRDDAFIWQRSLASDTIPIEIQIQRSYRFATQDSWDYVVMNVGRIVISVLAGLLLLLVVRSIIRIKQHEGESSAVENQNIITESVVPVVSYSGIYVYTATVIIMLMVLTKRPPLLTEALLLLFTVPLVVLVVKRSKGVIRFLTISFLLLYWLYNFTDLLILDNRLTSYIDFGYAIVATSLLFVLNANRKAFREQFPQIYEYIQRSFIPYLLVLTACAVLLQAIGFSTLGRALTNGAITFIYLAPVILICSVISRDLFRIFEQTPAVKYSVLAQKYYRFIYTFIKYGALYLLLITLINAYSLRPLFNATLQSIWTFGGQFGEFNVTVGGVLSFFSIILVSWVISVVMQVLLEGEILSRFNLRRGVAMAIGVMVRYSIIVLGFLLAIASTGFDLTKISILAGALGVGIGFGLQNLVANFISGLILIFERPFVVNDIIETNQIEGNVKEIGMRASKILTYDGAEVIIPNSELISNRFSNWTLSNASRRQLIVIRTSMKADPEEVIKIIHNMAILHPNILDTPEPFVLFDGQTDQSLQFKLYYWLVSDMFKTRSDLNLQIYHELKYLGVELPLQTYEVVLKNNVQEKKLD
ncbi:MAG: mechanosensitive ion channel [Cyclobacteriaceae bacterium]|nr:mechanosensitive ion channel [Cyclobacteriaceae bacterium]